MIASFDGAGGLRPDRQRNSRAWSWRRGRRSGRVRAVGGHGSAVATAPLCEHDDERAPGDRNEPGDHRVTSLSSVAASAAIGRSSVPRTASGDTRPSGPKRSNRRDARRRSRPTRHRAAGATRPADRAMTVDRHRPAGSHRRVLPSAPISWTTTLRPRSSGHHGKTGRIIEGDALARGDRRRGDRAGQAATGSARDEPAVRDPDQRAERRVRDRHRCVRAVEQAIPAGGLATGPDDERRTILAPREVRPPGGTEAVVGADRRQEAHRLRAIEAAPPDPEIGPCPAVDPALQDRPAARVQDRVPDRRRPRSAIDQRQAGPTSISDTSEALPSSVPTSTLPFVGPVANDSASSWSRSAPLGSGPPSASH